MESGRSEQRLEMKADEKHPPVIYIVGSSGAGKTTLLEKLIPELRRRGYRIGTIKHDVHGFQMDRPGKDSWRHKEAGAVATVISSPTQVGMVRDVDHDYSIDELTPLLSDVDVILTEGYKSAKAPKLEVFRPGVNSGAPLCKDDAHLVAVISDAPVNVDVPRFETGAIEKLADFLVEQFGLARAPFKHCTKALS